MCESASPGKLVFDPKYQWGATQLQGYVYVLVNGSLPGLVKIGMTTKSPDDRAQELSSSTGVPTPFIVAFQRPFIDCKRAEQRIHAELEARGLRSASNREFFSISPTEAIQCILAASETSAPVETYQDDLELPPADDLFEPVNLSVSNPWEEILQEAQSYEFGINDHFENHSEAIRLYKIAAKMGSAVGYQKVGDLLLSGNGVKRDIEAAIKFLTHAARMGRYEAYIFLTLAYGRAGHEGNFQKAFSYYCDGYNEDPGSKELEKGPLWWRHVSHILIYAGWCSRMEWKPELNKINNEAFLAIERFIEENPFNEDQEALSNTKRLANFLMLHRAK